MLSALFFAMSAFAAEGGALVIVGIDPGGATLIEATLGAGPSRPVRTPTRYTLSVLDAEGRVLATAPVPDTSFRSVIGPDGVGQSTTLLATSAAVAVEWPPGAVQIALGSQRIQPSVRPPSVPVAVQQSGPDTERLDLVFLGDGYTESELATFAADVDRMVQHLASIEPYGAYTGLFNIWRVDTASNESGGTHLESNPTVERDTAYGCYYGCGGIDRLVCCDDDRVLSEVAASVPAADGVLVLVNDPTYGGAGGWQYATSYNGSDWGEEVAAHELGHSLVGLWDEYDYGYANSGDEGPNCSSNATNPSWSAWSDEPGVGAYPVCSYTNLVRPTDNACMMNTLQDRYCPVCREQAVLAIYSHIPRIISLTDPPEGTIDGVEGTPLRFSATVLGPDDGSLSLAWTLGEELVGEGTSVELPGCGDTEYLSLQVADPTPWVRTDERGQLRDEARWLVRREPCAVTDDSPIDSPDAPDGDDSGGSIKSPCGCASAGSSAGWGLLAALSVAARRRKWIQ